MWLASITLWHRDIVRFLRQGSRVVGALATPVVFWIVLGSGFGQSFRPPGGGDAGYLAWFFPGTIAMIVLFSAIFSTISVIEDRQQGFLQGVLVAPCPRVSIVVGKLLGGTTLALLQALPFLAVAPLVGVTITWAAVPATIAIIALLAFALTGLGFAIAWRLDSTQGFHAIMNLLLVPMWLLSGAVFPAAGASGWVRWLMAANPMTYGVAALKDAMLGPGTGGPTPGVAWMVTAVFALAMLGLGAALVGRASRAGR
jgi:ABC-2 type transport system permease protein